MKNELYTYSNQVRELAELAYCQDPNRAHNCLIRMGLSGLAAGLKLDHQVGRLAPRTEPAPPPEPEKADPLPAGWG